MSFFVSRLATERIYRAARAARASARASASAGASARASASAAAGASARASAGASCGATTERRAPQSSAWRQRLNFGRSARRQGN